MGDAAATGLNGSELYGRDGDARGAPSPEEPRARAAGPPLPARSGSADPAALTAGTGEPGRTSAAALGGRTLANPAAEPPLDIPSGVQRAVSAIRAALPLMQKILPLLDGNFATAAANVLTPRPHMPPPAPPVNLAPIEDGLAQLQTRHRELCDQVAEQNSSLQRVEEHLERVRQATDRNTLEHQELMEDLRGVGNKVNRVALVALGLLAFSVVINVILYLRMVRVLP